MTDVLVPADERSHEPGPEETWNESWYFDFATRDGSLGGYVRIGFHPHLDGGKVWYWACLVGEGRPLVTVIDHDVPTPRGASLEIRSEGLWADHTVEAPFDHFSLGCEAFALALDDPSEVYRDPRGDRVAFGLDLEWETDGGVYAYPGVTRYEVPCHVHGEVLVGDERLDIDAIGQRDHSWGTRDWWTPSWMWTAGWLDDGTRFHGTAVWLGEQQVPYHPGYVTAGGTSPDPGLLSTTGSEADLGAHGLPRRATVTLGELELAVAPVAFSPVRLSAGGGRESRFPRALSRFRAADGRDGVGWIEWNQPQSS